MAPRIVCRRAGWSRAPPVSNGNLRSRRAGEPLVRTIVFQGSADPTVNPANANRILDTAGRRLGAAKREVGRVPSGRSYTRSVFPGLNGASAAEIWIVDGAGHAWSGGQPGGSYTDPEGPDASACYDALVQRAARIYSSGG